jgi:hypothetical protein
MLLIQAIVLEIRIGFALMDRGYIDADVTITVNGMNLRYIIRVKRFKNIEIRYSKRLRQVS